MNLQQIQELAKIVNEQHLDSIEVQSGDTTIKIKAGCGEEPAAKPCEAPVRQEETPVPRDGAQEIRSPMVGIFYAASSPEAEPYVKVGSRVKKGDVLCLIEAMKLMNEITAERDGEIVSICAENGQVVEYSQVLFTIRGES